MKTNALCCGLALCGAILLPACCSQPRKMESNKTEAPSAQEHSEWLKSLPSYKDLKEMPDYRASTQKFFDRVKQRTTYLELQTWATNVLAKYAGTTETQIVASNEVPRFVQDLDPPLRPVVRVFPKTETTETFVMIDWGSGWGHWGILAGRETFSPTELDLYVIKWERGVFVFHTNK